MATIRALDYTVIAKLRANIAAPSLPVVVEELVLNAIDADATSVEVWIDPGRYFVQVRDNGTGVCLEDLHDMGCRHATSKLSSYEDLQTLRTYGFRGEALSSIAESSYLEITTRSRSSFITYQKHIKYGQSSSIQKSPTSRNPGTTITVKEFCSLYPVRRKTWPSSGIQIEKIREFMIRIALANEFLSLSLYEDSKQTKLLHIKPRKDLEHSLTSILDVSMENLSKIDFKEDCFRFSGVITSLDSFCIEKPAQMFYVNKRYIRFNRIYRSINDIFFKLKTTTHVHSVTIDHQDPHTLDSRNTDKVPTFVIYLECPSSEYDISFDMDKAAVEFKSWDQIINILSNSLMAAFGIDREQSKHPSISTEGDLDSSQAASQKLDILRSLANCNNHRHPLFRETGPTTSKQDKPASDQGRIYSNTAHDTELNDLAKSQTTERGAPHQILLSQDSQALLKRRRVLSIQHEPTILQTRLGLGQAEESVVVETKAEESNGDDYQSCDTSHLTEVGPDLTAEFSLVQMFKVWQKNSGEPITNPNPECVKNSDDTLAEDVFSAECRITRDQLQNMEVLCQVDKKFILTKLGTSIYVMDQHAVHERICLERIQRECYDLDRADCKIKSVTDITPPLVVRLDAQEYTLFQGYQTQFSVWGFTLRFPRQVGFGDDESTCAMIVQSRPTVLVEQFCTHNGLMKTIRNYLQQLQRVGGAKTSIPRDIIRSLNQKACKGAIRFGDPLTIEQCRSLLGQLVHCNFPFQCAHGRPSIVPVCTSLPFSAPQRGRLCLARLRCLPTLAPDAAADKPS